MTTSEKKRTTLLLSEKDQRLVKDLADILQTSDMEAIRRSVRFAHFWFIEGGGEGNEKTVVLL